MANNYLITGYWGEPHVTAENDRGIHAAIFGPGRFVLPVGEQFKAEYIGNNTVRVYDGKLLDNGAAAGIPAGEYVDLVIANASQSMKRNDLIVFQYEQDAATLVENGKFVVVQGEEVSGTASDPVLTQNDLLSNTATFDQFALWRVPVSGATISAPVQLFTVSKNLSNVGDDEVPDHTHKASDVTSGVFSIERGGTGASTLSEAKENLGIALESGDLAVTVSGSYMSVVSNSSKWYKFGNVVYLYINAKLKCTNMTYWSSFSVSGHPKQGYGIGYPPAYCIGTITQESKIRIGYLGSNIGFANDPTSVSFKLFEGDIESTLVANSDIEIKGAIMYLAQT